MADLDALAARLRSELGPAPASHDAQWRRVLQDPRFSTARSREPRRWIVGFALAAAALVLYVSLAGPFAESARQLAAGAAPVELVLEDRSELVLDRESRGRLEEDSDGTLFRLESGKVELSVTPRAGRRFEVLAAGYVVAVVGTSFSVRIGETGRVAVEVSRGLVTVTPPRGEPSVELRAGERLEGDAEGKVAVVRSSSPSSATSPASKNEAPASSAEAPGLAPPRASAPQAPSARVATGKAGGRDWRAEFRARRYTDALSSAREIGVERLLVELDARALSDLADVARLGGDANLNLRVLRTLRARFPRTPEAARAAFLLGRAHALAGNKRDAVLAFEAHLAEAPGGAHAVEAMGRLMELYSAMGDRARARSMAERYLERAPSGPYERLARSLTAP